MKRFALYVYSLFVLFIIYLILILSYATLTDYQPEDFKIISTQKIGDDYVYEVDPRKEIVTNYMETKFEIKNYEKPIKSVSSYKLQELKELYDSGALSKDQFEKAKKKLLN